MLPPDSRSIYLFSFMADFAHFAVSRFRGFFPPLSRFNCLCLDNVIREVLSQKLHEDPASPQQAYISDPDEPANQAQARADRRHKNVQKLYDQSESHCRNLHQGVMRLIAGQLESPTFFQWDASLVRDGSTYPHIHTSPPNGADTDLLCDSL